MTARLTEFNRRRREPSVTPSENGHQPSSADQQPRVVSVSARAANSSPEKCLPMTEPRDSGESVFLTPRVIDQAVFDELAGTLRRLVDQAEHAGRELKQRVEETAQTDRDQARAIEQLQERLRLSARMLKAFQSQIVRTETAIAELEAQEQKNRTVQDEVDRAVESAQKRIDAAVEAALDRFAQQIDERSNAAMAQFENQLQAKAERLAQLSEQIESLAPAAERLVEIAESAEVNVAASAHRAAAVICELRERSETIGELTERADAVAQKLDSRATATEAAAGQLERACERSRSLRDELAVRIDNAETASRNLAVDSDAREAIQSLLEQLKPWEAFVMQQQTEQAQGGADLPEPAARLVRQLHERIDRDLDAFASVLAQVAQQLQALAQRDSEPLSSDDDAGAISVIRSSLSFRANVNGRE